jgi:hypothetical protein
MAVPRNALKKREKARESAPARAPTGVEPTPALTAYAPAPAAYAPAPAAHVPAPARYSLPAQ